MQRLDKLAKEFVEKVETLETLAKEPVEKLKKLVIQAYAIPYKPHKRKFILQMKRLRTSKVQHEPVIIVLLDKEIIKPRAFFTTYTVKQLMTVQELYETLFGKLNLQVSDFKALLDIVYGNFLLWLVQTYELDKQAPTPATITYCFDFLLKHLSVSSKNEHSYAFNFESFLKHYRKLLRKNPAYALAYFVQNDTLYIPLRLLKRVMNAIGSFYELTSYALLEVLVFQSSYLSIELLSDVEMLCIPKEKTPPAYWFLFEPSAQKSKVGGNGHE